MNKKPEVKKIVERTLCVEIEGLHLLHNSFPENFEIFIEKLQSCTAKLIWAGLGKSGLVAQKIVATLNSLGTQSIFLHISEAIHGDCGVINKEDIIIILSKNGDGVELRMFLDMMKRFKNYTISIVENENSYLKSKTDMTIILPKVKESCSLQLAPTTSSIVQMSFGHCVANTLMELKNFTKNDFARNHPGGVLGKELYMTIGDIAKENGKPWVKKQTSIKLLISEMTKHRMGACVVLNDREKIVGIITDGDLRRLLEKTDHIQKVIAEELMNTKPITIYYQTLAKEALSLMRKNNISQLILVDENNNYFGMAHLHDILKQGLN